MTASLAYLELILKMMSVSLDGFHSIWHDDRIAFYVLFFLSPLASRRRVYHRVPSSFIILKSLITIQLKKEYHNLEGVWILGFN